MSPRVILKLILLFSLTLLIPYLILCFYAHPVADDYSFNSQSLFWHTQLQLYFKWNGRYSSNFLAMCEPLVLNSFARYRLVAGCLLVLMPISILFMLSSIMGGMVSYLQKILSTYILTAIILALLPSLPEGIYWYSGSVTYILGCIVALFYIGIVIRYDTGRYVINQPFHFCLCIILLFCAIGFNEVQMFLLLFGHFILWLNMGKERRFRSFGVIMLLVCVLFALLVFFSPGNHSRGNWYPNSHNIFNSLCMSLLQMGKFFFSWISYAPLLLGSILFAPISLKLSKRSALFQQFGRYNPWNLFLLLGGILFVCIFPAYWSTGILGQHRTLNTACFFFVPAWFVFFHSIYSRNNLAERITQTLKRPMQISLIVLLIVSLLFSGNCGTALIELVTGRVSGFDKEMNNRDMLLMIAKKQGRKAISVPSLQNKPNSLFVTDIKPGYGYFVNGIYAVTFGLEKVYMDSTRLIQK